jgi:hypothetical protein
MFYLRSGNAIKITLWGEAAFRFNGHAVRFRGQEESAVAIFVGATIYTCEGMCSRTSSLFLGLFGFLSK